MDLPIPRRLLPSARVIALSCMAMLGAGNALAQVGRYDPEAVSAHQKKEQEKARQDAAKCASPLEAAKAHLQCSSHYDRAVQPPQPSEPSPQGKPMPKADGVLFPGATRESPDLQATKAGGKVLTEIVALYQAKQYPEAIAKADALAGATDNAYERSFADQIAASAAADAGDQTRAATYFQKALDANGLNNDEHYQVMYNLAVSQYGTQHPADALATLDRLTSQTKADGPQYTTLRAALLAQLHRPQDAAGLFEQAYAKDPTNTRALMNAVAAYEQANNGAKATALLADAQKRGALTDAAQYRALYVGYINDNKPQQALAVIDDGLAKGLVQPSTDLAKAYAVIAQNAYAAGDAATAIAMYRRAAPIAGDGEPALNLARVLWNEKRPAEAREAARQALQKGVKNTAEATKLAAPGHK